MLSIMLIVTVGTIFNTICSETSMTAYAQTGSDFRVYSETPYIPVSAEYDAYDLDSGTNGTEISPVILEGDSIAFDGSGATVNGTTITITSAGIYNIYGTLNDGQICVDTEDGEEILTVVPTKAYQSVVFCSSELKEGIPYDVYSGGSSTGTATYGLYTPVEHILPAPG
ncbi:carbohydrate-binding domain-containing protein [Methanogenium marinum]|uniref:Carbohydrate-binding domain-containing protein n=1 Tax=Methanogenium marinum TaxID=348610 RepID=A0A9Q4KP90_9EURY|nr:carbohydrate-binding domain-containing protein [Methanogenium marinum]MDE4907700.1 carbohydrate-binding domain-containing protein [Methanogenium marinum]